MLRANSYLIQCYNSPDEPTRKLKGTKLYLLLPILFPSGPIGYNRCVLYKLIPSNHSISFKKDTQYRFVQWYIFIINKPRHSKHHHQQTTIFYWPTNFHRAWTYATNWHNFMSTFGNSWYKFSLETITENRRNFYKDTFIFCWLIFLKSNIRILIHCCNTSILCQLI